MTSDLERLARAHYEAGHKAPAPAGALTRWATWDELKEMDGGVDRHLNQMRAVLTELLTPSEGMLDMVSDPRNDAVREFARGDFTAMIQSILQADPRETT